MATNDPAAMTDYKKEHPYIIINKTILDKETVNSKDEFIKAMINKNLLSIERDDGIGVIVDKDDITIEKVYYKIGEDEEDITKIVTAGDKYELIKIYSEGRAFFFKIKLDVEKHGKDPKSEYYKLFELQAKRLKYYYHTDLVFEFAIEVYSDDMSRRDIKPGSKLFTRNLYQTTGKKKKEIEKSIHTNIVRLQNIKNYLEAYDGGKNKEIKQDDLPDGKAGESNLVGTEGLSEKVFGNGTPTFLQKIPDDKIDLYNIHPNIYNYFKNIKSDIHQIEEKMVVRGYKYNMEKWRKFVMSYGNRFDNKDLTQESRISQFYMKNQEYIDKNHLSEFKKDTRFIKMSNYLVPKIHLIGVEEPTPKDGAQIIENEKYTTEFITKTAENKLYKYTNESSSSVIGDNLFKLCKENDVTDEQKRELYSFAEYDENFVKLVIFTDNLVYQDSGSGTTPKEHLKGAIRLGINYCADMKKNIDCVEPLFLTRKGYITDEKGNEYMWDDFSGKGENSNTTYSLKNRDSTGKLGFIKVVSNSINFTKDWGARSGKRMFDHLNYGNAFYNEWVKTNLESASNLLSFIPGINPVKEEYNQEHQAVGGKKYTKTHKKRKTLKKRASKKRR